MNSLAALAQYASSSSSSSSSSSPIPPSTQTQRPPVQPAVRQPPLSPANTPSPPPKRQRPAPAQDALTLSLPASVLRELAESPLTTIDARAALLAPVSATAAAAARSGAVLRAASGRTATSRAARRSNHVTALGPAALAGIAAREAAADAETGGGKRKRK